MFPHAGEVAVDEAYGGLGLGGLAPPDRPYVIANMVATADGRATLGGSSRPLSSETDRALFLELRTQVDAVMVGPATIGIEGYGPIVRSDERRRRRRAQGLGEVPLAVTASRSLELPVQAPLFQDSGSRVVVLTNSEGDPSDAPADVIVERIPGDELDLLEGLRRLRAKHGVRSLLLEGGPTLLAAVTSAGGLDELFLTVASKLVGGDGELGLLEGSAPLAPLELELKSVLLEGSYLYLRYAVGAAR